MASEEGRYIGSLERRYSPKSFEENILRFWEEAKIYEKARARRGPKYYFLDGPPYPSSDVPHIGTAWNKSMKDAVIRYRRMRGYWVWDQPGYDTHGLPIEVATEKRLGISNKREIEEKVGVERFIEECKRLAIENSRSMSRHFWDLGVSMDWDNPYYTLKNEYIESSWWLIKKAHEKGLLTRDLGIVWWCPRCETVLSDYEVSEYRDLKDPSIYVRFPLRDGGASLLVWTTTPWTLPANVFVMAHPDEEYVEVEVEGERLILMEARLEAVMGDKEYRVLRRFPGRELEGLRYVHPLRKYVKLQEGLDEYHIVVTTAEHVSREEGTGLVHAAPGHGEEDFTVGRSRGFPVVSPVDERGVYREEVGKYAGMNVFEANEEIIRDLERDGYLFKRESIVHKYPVCWRCKSRLIIRATEQWFIRVTKIRDELIKALEEVDITPSWGVERFRNWLMELRDWVISRQRYWGIPIPVWVCRDCGDYVVIGSRSEIEERIVEGSLEDLHRPWIDRVRLRCRCGGVMERVPDVLDVWFDSGVAFYASLSYPMREEPFKTLYPVDFITEGHDQIRGWFFSLLRAGVIGFDESPYKRLQIHGFVLDEKGREMHKSLGNYVSPTEVVDRFGRDILRYTLLQYTIWEDLKFSWAKLEHSLKDLNILWNVYLFASMYMNLDRYRYDEHPLEKYLDFLRPEDRWILSRVNTVLKEYLGAMDRAFIHEALRTLRDFFVEDLSRLYIRLVRWRTWLEGDDPAKLSAYAVLYYVLYRLLLMLSPITPFLTEKIYRDMFLPALSDGPESIHLDMLPDPDEELIDPRLEELMSYIDEVLEAGGAARMEAGLKFRIPVKKIFILSDDPGVRDAVEVFREVLRSQLNVKEVEVLPTSEESSFMVRRVRPVMRAMGPVFKADASRVAEMVVEKGGEVVTALQEKGYYVVQVDGKEYRVTPDMVEIVEEPDPRYVVRSFPHGVLVLDREVSREELAMGLARDVVRRIQAMRKEMDLPISAYVSVYVATPDEETAEMLREHSGYIANETRAKNLVIGPGVRIPSDHYRREWEISGEGYVIGVKQV